MGNYMLEALPIIGNVLGKVIDRLFPDPVKDAEAKAELVKAVSKLSSDELNAQASIVKQEAASESWLTANWRPLTMMVFLGFIVSAWFGYIPKGLPADVLNKLFDIIQYGLCGYVGSRTIDKSVTNIATILKKKD